METVFPYIPVHMEYIFFELLKNSLRATVEFCESSKLTAPPFLISCPMTPFCFLSFFLLVLQMASRCTPCT